MRAYLATTGIMFALIVAAHALRLASEGVHLVRNPWWDLLTVVAAGMSFWAWYLFRRTGPR
jgi:hypothetical protein